MSRLGPDTRALRERMVQEQLIDRGIHDPHVLTAMRSVPRHLFVPPLLRRLAYEDGPLPIGCRQTISQPYIVGLMSELLVLTGDEIVLEVGTGSGYQAAVLSLLSRHVYTIERHESLTERTSRLLRRMRFLNITVIGGDGSRGLPDRAPFDAILVSAAAPVIPDVLREQLAPFGRLVIPVGDRHGQTIERVWRIDSSWQVEHLAPVMFVPLIGEYGWQIDVA